MKFNSRKTQFILNWCSQYWYWIALAIVILSVAVIRAHLLGVPLERDEGEYAYAGQLILQGIPPFAQVYNMKMPGIYAAYALIMALFGESHSAIHLGLLVVNAATILLLFLLGRTMLNTFAGLTAAAAFALLSMGQQVQGIFAHAEHFVVLAAVGGILLLVRAIDSNKRSTLFAGSVLLGLAFIMKQHGVAFIAFGCVYLISMESRRRPFDRGVFITRGLIFLGGVTFPFALTCLVLQQAGVFEKFWFWTFTYAREYVSSVPVSIGMERLAAQLGGISGSSFVIWAIAATGLTALFWNRRRLENISFSLLFFVFSFLAVFPGFYFRPHYFVLFLPAVAFFAGIGASSLYDLFGRIRTFPALKLVPVLFVLFGLFYGLWQQREFLLTAEPNQASRMTYGLNPFPESLEIARFIKENTDENDKIAVIGSEPQIYFYSNRHSATGHIYTYALMESHPYALSMQKEMIREIQNVNPEYLVFVNIPTSWLARSESQRLIFDWFNKYSRSRYELTGLVELGADGTRYIWNEEVKEHKAKSPYTLLIFSRKG